MGLRMIDEFAASTLLAQQILHQSALTYGGDVKVETFIR
jgi:hypothetical protein